MVTKWDLNFDYFVFNFMKKSCKLQSLPMNF